MSSFQRWNNETEKQAEFAKEALVHLDALYNASYKLTHNEEDAKDLVQEALFKAYRFFGQFQVGTSCKAWLFKILKNTFINHYRKRVKQPEILGYENVEPFINLVKDRDVYFTRGAEEKMFDKFLSDDVKRALEKLSPEFKLVVILADIEGFSYKEIADIMECPIGTVRSRLSRGRKMMEKVLQEYASKEGITKKTG